MENSKSSYVKIINEICAEEGIKLAAIPMTGHFV